MNEGDKELMARYGITGITKMVYCYKQYKYNNLADAYRYAMHDNNFKEHRNTSKSTKVECTVNKEFNAK